MINLLPPAAKHEFAAGRVNALLVRYIWITLILFGLLAALCGLTYVALNGSKETAQQLITANETSVAGLQQIQAQSAAFKSDLATAKAILDQQTYYTSTLLKIGGLITPGTTIDSLSLDQSSYGTAPITLQVMATSEQAALDLKSSLQSSDLFSDVHFESITFASNDETHASSVYPVTAQLVLTINKGAR